jgi:ketosteroid isomerase-like protein
MTPPADIVSDLQLKWTLFFNQRDIDGLASLYSRESCLFGGKPDLYVAVSGIHSYFSALPPFGLRAEFGDSTVVKLSTTVINSAGFVTFGKAQPAPSDAPMRYRITLALIEEDGAWKIACHHASPVPM